VFVFYQDDIFVSFYLRAKIQKNTHFLAGNENNM